MQVCAENVDQTQERRRNSLKLLLDTKPSSVNELIQTLIESEWQEFRKAQAAEGVEIPHGDAELILGFARLSLQHVLFYTRNVIEAARLKKTAQKAENSPIEASPDVMSNMSAYATPLTPSRVEKTPEPRTPESKLLSYNDQTPGAGASEVARRAIQRTKSIRKPRSIEQIDRLRRSVIILTGDWPVVNSRHATVIELRVGSLVDMIDRLTPHAADWSKVGQIMLFCDAAWFLPQTQVVHDDRQYSLNKLLGFFHDRAPEARVYMCEPVPLMANVQFIENMNHFIDFARAKAALDPLFRTLSLFEAVKPFPYRTHQAHPFYLRRQASENVVQEMTKRFEVMASRLGRRSEDSPMSTSSMNSLPGPSPWRSVPTQTDVDVLCADSPFTVKSHNKDSYA